MLYISMSKTVNKINTNQFSRANSHSHSRSQKSRGTTATFVVLCSLICGFLEVGLVSAADPDGEDLREATKEAANATWDEFQADGVNVERDDVESQILECYELARLKQLSDRGVRNLSDVYGEQVRAKLKENNDSGQNIDWDLLPVVDHAKSIFEEIINDARRTD